MANLLPRFLVKLSHPIYAQRSAVVNAPDLATAQALAAAKVKDTEWAVVDVAPLVVDAIS